MDVNKVTKCNQELPNHFSYILNYHNHINVQKLFTITSIVNPRKYALTRVSQMYLPVSYISLHFPKSFAKRRRS